MSWVVLNLKEMISNGVEETAKVYINNFSCSIEGDNGKTISLNPGIEYFLKHNAIQFAKMKTSITFLVFDGIDEAFLGFFTLTHKPLDIPADGLSRKIKDKIKRFSTLNERTNTYTVSAFLLAQFSKNYNIEQGKRISGSELMEIAKEKLLSAQNIVGGTLLYLDCEPDAKLINFYENEGFVLFGERVSESDHKHYLQYLSFI